MTITIEIGDGQNENIFCREGDDPYVLAREFAKKHGIGEQLTDLLADQIKLNIDSMVENNQQTGQKQQVEYDEKLDEVMSMMSSAPQRSTKNQNEIQAMATIETQPETNKHYI